MGCYPSQLYEENFESKTSAMNSVSRDELMHQRLQAWLREFKCDDLKYLGFHEDIYGVSKHWYSIAGNEVSVDCIEDFDPEDLEPDESDSL